jgi:uncharacterized protein
MLVVEQKPVIPIVTDRAREARIAQRANILSMRLEADPKNWRKEARALAESREPVWVRLRKLRAIVDRIATYQDGQVACREGCSHCCYIAASVLGPEAEMIGHEIGRKPKRPKSDAPGEVPAFGFNYDNPCTFLKDNRCSIYESRPMACRIYASMAFIK